MYAKNNEHMNPETFVWTDGKFDYCIVNGESVTKYYGEIGGEYESYPLHKFVSVSGMPNWVIKTLDKGWEMYEHKERLLEMLQNLSLEEREIWSLILFKAE